MPANASVPGLPASSGKGVLLFATGQYRKSSAYLAWAPVDSIGDLTTWRYYGSCNPSSNWCTSETDAAPLVDSNDMGELSVTWNPYLSKWMMLYNALTPFAIVFRTADAPTGPWSPAEVLYDPWREDGYGEFMHWAYCKKNETCSTYTLCGDPKSMKNRCAPSNLKTELGGCAPDDSNRQGNRINIL